MGQYTIILSQNAKEDLVKLAGKATKARKLKLND